MIHENNKLIAEFMGYIYYEPSVEFEIDEFPSITDVYSKVPILITEYEGAKYFEMLPNPDFGKVNSERWNSTIQWISWETVNHGQYIYNLKYNTSWEWLMPVVEKIESETEFWVEIAEKNCSIKQLNQHKSTIVDIDANTKIEATWKAIVEFIKISKRAN